MTTRVMYKNRGATPELARENLMCFFCGKPIRDLGVHICISIIAKGFDETVSRTDKTHKAEKIDYAAHYRCAGKRNIWVSMYGGYSYVAAFK